MNSLYLVNLIEFLLLYYFDLVYLSFDYWFT